MRWTVIPWMMLACAIVASIEVRADGRQQDTRVDVELVLAVDVSFSIGIEERDVQRLAYVDAFRSPSITSSITSGYYRRIAVTYVEWAEAEYQRVVIPWRLIANPADAARFADDLETAPVHRSGATSISAALRFSAALFRDNGYQSDRLIIDISGDGPNNDGEPVSMARDALDALGITVTALPLASAESELTPEELTSYYHACVATGPGSFTLPATSTEDFALAMQRKMVAEITRYPSPLMPRHPVIRIWRVSIDKVDCLMGERQRREEYFNMLLDLTNGRPERWQPDSKTWPVP
ncbi:MAG: DUF1194 domain-containing protein [Pseudomonadota bacterium]